MNQPPASRHADYYEDNVPAMPQNRVHPYMREWARNNTAPAPAPEPTEGGTYPWAAIDALNNKTAMINIAAEMTHVDEGIGTALVYHGGRNQKFRDAFPDWREPFVEKQTAFRDRIVE